MTDARVLALNLMTVFDHLGYELMATIDMNTGNSDDGRDSESIRLKGRGRANG